MVYGLIGLMVALLAGASNVRAFTRLHKNLAASEFRFAAAQLSTIKEGPNMLIGTYSQYMLRVVMQLDPGRNMPAWNMPDVLKVNWTNNPKDVACAFLNEITTRRQLVRLANAQQQRHVQRIYSLNYDEMSVCAERHLRNYYMPTLKGLRSYDDVTQYIRRQIKLATNYELNIQNRNFFQRNDSTVPIATSIAYFSGQFDVAAFRVVRLAFKLTDTLTDHVDAAQAVATFAIADDSCTGARILQLPYRTDVAGDFRNYLSMLIILPRGDLRTFLSAVTAEQLRCSIRQLTPQNVRLTLPFFKVRSHIFTTSNYSIGQNFTLWQEAKINLYEMINEMSAENSSTAPEVVANVNEFTVDRPFAYLIYDALTEMILFAGATFDPKIYA